MKLLKLLWDRSLTDWRYRLIGHIAFWSFLLFFWLGESLVVTIKLDQHYAITLTGILFSLFLFYPLVYLIVPLYRRKKYVLATAVFFLYYIIAILLRTYHIGLLIEWYNNKRIWFAGQDFWKKFYETQLGTWRFITLFFSSVASLLEIIFIPLIIKFSRYAYNVNADKAALEKENIILQLNFLKAQLNPHFLFNTLNNLQSFIVHGESDKSVKLLNKFSDFLRSSLYDCSAEYLALQKEADIMGNYIEIEKVRYDEYAKICYELQIEEKTAQVPSLLFMPLVENAFKYSSALPGSEVDIRINLHNANGNTHFSIYNRYGITNLSYNAGGIGLRSVYKRLEHYYNNKHTIRVSESNNIFTVNIAIQH